MNEETQVELRDAVEADLEFLELLYASTRQSELEALEWSDEQKQTFLHQQFQAQDAYYHEHFPDCSYQVIESAGDRIGRLYLHRREDEIRIVDIALLPEHRGRGVGWRLMQEILNEAGEQGLPVRIHVEQYNPALQLYERLGFRHLGEVGVYFFMEWSPEIPSG